MKIKKTFLILVMANIIFITNPYNSLSYSVLTHEAVIDACWDESIKPFLIFKYPNSSPTQLKEAQAYAYGGAIIPDMGYYPFGSKFFTNLIHYVRTGELANAVYSESTNLNELAFSLGMLAHYNADNFGHSIGVNYAVPLVYPKIKEKFGEKVSYADDHTSHVRMEFGFDVLQVAVSGYTPEKFHEFIGFEISEKVLERAFLKTYGFQLKEIFMNLPLAISTFRWSVKTAIPELTKAAFLSKKVKIQNKFPEMTLKKYQYKMPRSDFRKEFSKKYKKPGVSAHILKIIIKGLPKIGPLKILKFKPPTPEAEKLFVESFNLTLKNYSDQIKNLYKDSLHLKNTNLDTGVSAKAGEYTLSDETYSQLINKLAKINLKDVPPSLKHNILSFYNGYIPEFKSRNKKEHWQRTLVLIEILRTENL
jgi:hypothetical protein